MATDNLEEGVEVTPAAFHDLRKRLEKAEKKLEKAKARAQQTMQEIWQLDVKLKEEEERANLAEAKLADSQGRSAGGEDSAVLLAEIEQLKSELKEARAEVAHVVELELLVDDLKVQLAQLNDELAQRSAPDVSSRHEEVAELRAQLSQMQEEAAAIQTDLQVRIAELEQALTQSQQHTESESSGSQERVRELEAQIEELEQRLSVAQTFGSQASGEQPAEPMPEDLFEARLAGLRLALHEAEERAVEAESRLSGVDGSASVFEEQLRAIQEKVREAEERALEWEERFHQSEERALLAQAGGAESAGDEQFIELQDRICELETELAEARLGHAGDASAEAEELRRELMEAQDRICELESRAGVSIEEYQRLEKELEDFQAELEEANKRSVDGGPAPEEFEEKLSEYRERLNISEQKSELLEQKASQAQERAAEFQKALDELGAERDRLGQELSQAQSRISELNYRLENSNGSSSSIGIAGGDNRLSEALQRAREAELKANQAEIQLKKAKDALAEYEQRANESDRETQRLAFQDALTGLPNLNLIRQYLEFTVKQSQRYGRASALLVVDLDRFKLINDAMGFKAGDELLTKVAERLQTAIRESDALGRKGEDEFLILLSELITGDDNAPAEQKTNMIRQNIAIVVNRISECLSRPFNIQGQKFYIRASIGVSICPNDADTAQKMLEHADSAMYHAKESGRGRCVFYNNELHKRQERRLTMDSQLRLAMEKGEFVLQYQPIIEMNKGKGQIVGVEALLRWNHRIDGLLAPASFLSIAEETGLICQLGQWVCRQSCWQLRQWVSQGHNLFVSFNVSTRQMLQADLAEMILNSVDEFGLQPGLIFVEISEGTNSEEVDLIERVVGNLGKVGVRVAIDDFGVGYSSLSRIDLQHIQFLKIDPSLVSGCQQERAKANICEAAVKLAQSLELRPLAEGVETLAQAKFLSKIGCQYLQGFHIQPPVDAAVITQLLNERRAWKF